MKAIYVIEFLIILLPAAGLAQEKKESCASADSVIARIKGSDSPLISLAKNPDCQLMLKGEDCEVVSFKMSMLINRRLVSKAAQGPMLTENMQESLKKAPKGTIVYLENILVKIIQEKLPGSLLLSL